MALCYSVACYVITCILSIFATLFGYSILFFSSSSCTVIRVLHIQIFVVVVWIPLQCHTCGGFQFLRALFTNRSWLPRVSIGVNLKQKIQHPRTSFLPPEYIYAVDIITFREFRMSVSFCCFDRSIISKRESSIYICSIAKPPKNQHIFAFCVCYIGPKKAESIFWKWNR